MTTRTHLRLCPPVHVGPTGQDVEFLVDGKLVATGPLTMLIDRFDWTRSDELKLRQLAVGQGPVTLESGAVARLTADNPLEDSE